jgi:hypothetical protein
MTVSIPSVFTVPLTEKSCPDGSRLRIFHISRGDMVVVVESYDVVDGRPVVIVSEFMNPGITRSFYSNTRTLDLADVKITGLVDAMGKLVYDHAALCKFASVREDYAARQAA